MARPLTHKQQAFIDNYCSNGYNGVQAAKSAGYKGCYATLNAVAGENLRKPAIKAGINVYIRKRQKKCEFNREQSELELNNAQQRAITKGDLSAEIAAIREKNVIFALRTETLGGQTLEQRKLDEKEESEARRIASIRLTEMGKKASGA